MWEKILKFLSADKDPNNAENLQKKNIIVIAIGLFTIIVFMMMLLDNGNNNNQKKEIGQFKIVNEEQAVKTKWMGQASTELQVTKRQVEQLKKQNELLQKQIEMMKKILNKRLNETPTNNTNNMNNRNVNNNQRFSLNNNQNTNLNTNLYTNYPMPPEFRNKNNNKIGSVPILKKEVVVKKEKLNNALAYVNIAQPEKPKKKEEEPKPEKIISTGTITKVILLGGMDAPTMARAKTNPLPVLMKVTDLSFLPNSWKMNIKGCFILGEGYGDLSSERAYIRTTTLSCITKDGYHIDTPFKGAVYGEDGKVGLRGRVVTKQGSLIARTLIAGFLQGISEAFKQSNTIVSVNPNGATQTIDPNKALQTGLYSGASEAMKKLADFYLKMADQIAPVIEISAGRRVDVIATDMIKLKPIEFMKKGQK